MLGCGAAGLPEHGDGLVRVRGPAVSAGGFDVEVGTAFGAERWWRLPSPGQVQGAGDVAALDRGGEFVDAMLLGPNAMPW